MFIQKLKRLYFGYAIKLFLLSPILLITTVLKSLLQSTILKCQIRILFLLNNCKIKQRLTLFKNKLYTLQTMNKIKFLVCNINTAFPTEINEMIFKEVQENASKVIQNMYYFRVKINLDFFIILSYVLPRISDCNYINLMIRYYTTKINYRYIQEPGTWITKLNIILNTRVIPGIDVNIIVNMINKIRAGNSIWSRTRIDWWENF